MTDVEQPAPTVGMGATLLYPSDRYPYVVTHVTASGQQIDVVKLLIVDRSTGHEPARFHGPWPIWDHTYTAAELESLRAPAPPQRAYQRADGFFYLHGSLLFLGRARYYRDYSD